MKFCTKLWYDKLYCATKNQPHIAYPSLFISSFFFLWIFILPSFSIFRVFFYHLSLLCAYGHFPSKISGITWLGIIKFGTKLCYEKLYCVTKNQPHIAYLSLYFFFLSFQTNFLWKCYNLWWLPPGVCELCSLLAIFLVHCGSYDIVQWALPSFLISYSIFFSNNHIFVERWSIRGLYGDEFISKWVTLH